MNVKDLISRWLYDSSVPIRFNINNKEYSYYEVNSNSNLLSIPVNSIKAMFKTTELTEEDIIIETDIKTNVDLILPANSHYHMIIIYIK
jgi:hypothetical protein